MFLGSHICTTPLVKSSVPGLFNSLTIFICWSWFLVCLCWEMRGRWWTTESDHKRAVYPKAKGNWVSIKHKRSLFPSCLLSLSYVCVCVFVSVSRTGVYVCLVCLCFYLCLCMCEKVCDSFCKQIVCLVRLYYGVGGIFFSACAYMCARVCVCRRPAMSQSAQIALPRISGVEANIKAGGMNEWKSECSSEEEE